MGPEVLGGDEGLATRFVLADHSLLGLSASAARHVGNFRVHIQLGPAAKDLRAERALHMRVSYVRTQLVPALTAARLLLAGTHVAPASGFTMLSLHMSSQSRRLVEGGQAACIGPGILAGLQRP